MDVGGARMAKKIIKVLVGIPTKGNTDPEAYDNRLEMFMHLGNLQTLSAKGEKEYCGVEYDIPDGVEYQFSLSTIGDVFVAYARQQMAYTAVNNGFDYLLMIDDDMICPPDLFEKLLRHNVDVVGFGSVLIKVEILEKLEKPWFMVMTGAGEDIHFCHQAKRAGFKIHMDTATKLGHLGKRKKITEHTYEHANDTDKEREEKGDTDKYKDFGPVRFEDRPGVVKLKKAGAA